MFKEILYPEQIENLRILEIFSKDFYLAWGTAISLQIGHRKSIDFDLFSSKPIDNSKILRILQKEKFTVSHTLIDNKWEELTCILWGTKVTFLYYPFGISLDSKNTFWGIQLPELLVLWAMKFYTLGRRWKWKDYVDVYFLFQKYTLKQISEVAESIFTGWYNEKLLREQLCYFKDIDFSEEVEYLWETLSQEQIQKFLIKSAKS